MGYPTSHSPFYSLSSFALSSQSPAYAGPGNFSVSEEKYSMDDYQLTAVFS